MELPEPGMDRMAVVVVVQRGSTTPATGLGPQPGVRGSIAALLAACLANRRPVVFVVCIDRAGSRLRPGQLGNHVKELLIAKHATSCLPGPPSLAALGHEGSGLASCRWTSRIWSGWMPRSWRG